MKRHIITLKHSSLEKRFYLVWDGEGAGKMKLSKAIGEIESFPSVDQMTSFAFFDMATQVFERNELKQIKR